MSDNIQFAVNEKRFELRIVKVNSLGVIGNPNAPTGPRLVAHVRPLEGGDWVRVPADGELNFDATERALIGARQYVEDHFHLWE